MTSPAIQRQIEKAIGVNSEQGKDEDMYCLGYTFVFALTGYRYDALSKLEAGERYEKAMQLLRETRVSLELAKLVAKLIDNTVEVRLTLAKLRKSLREK